MNVCVANSLIPEDEILIVNPVKLPYAGIVRKAQRSNIIVSSVSFCEPTYGILM